MAEKIRILYDNVGDKYTTVSATNTNAAFPITNAFSDVKGIPWRSTDATTATIIINWNTVQRISAVAFAFTNLTSTAFITVTLRDQADAVIYTSGPVSAIKGAIVPNNNYTVLGANSYSQGMGNYGAVWLPQVYTNVRKVEITVTDANAGAYFEISRIICGEYWSPKYNVSFGLTVGWADTSEVKRTEAGNLISLGGTMHKQLQFDLSYLTDTDRSEFVKLMRTLSTRKSMYVNVFPNDLEPDREQLYQIYGRLASSPTLTHPLFTQYTSSLSIDEV